MSNLCSTINDNFEPFVNGFEAGESRSLCHTWVKNNFWFRGSAGKKYLISASKGHDILPLADWYFEIWAGNFALMERRWCRYQF